jgi:hypothetical protein
MKDGPSGMEILNTTQTFIVSTDAMNMHNREMQIKGKTSVANNIYLNMNKVVDKDIPVDPDMARRREKESHKVFPFDLSESQWEDMKKEIDRMLQSSREQLNKDIKEAQARGNTELLEKVLIPRRINLNAFEDRLKNDDPSVATSLKALAVVNVLETDMKNISDRIAQISNKVDLLAGSTLTEQEKNQHLSEMTALLRSLKNFLDYLKSKLLMQNK